MVSFFSQLIKGEKSLILTFWIFYAFPCLFIESAKTYLLDYGDYRDKNIFDALSLLLPLYSAIMCICVWRSASKYKGPIIWHALAKFFVVMNVIALSHLIFELAGMLPAK